MFKVKNKKTINFLAKNSLKEYKMRNIFTLIAIILSVTLISGLAFFSSAIQETNRKDLISRQHVIYHEVSYNQIKSIRQNEEILSSKEFKRGKSFEVDDYIMLPYYMEQNESSMLNLNIIHGKYPKEINEVLVYEEMLVKMGVEPRVGETISISFLDGSTEEFTVSGLTKSEGTTDVFPLYLSKEYAINGSQLKAIPFDISAQIVDAEKMSSEEFLTLIRKIGANSGIERKNINENNAFVKSLSYSFRELTMITLISSVILLVSILVVYSIFYISISERTRQFGQLRTIGMTQKQVKRMVRKEGTTLSLIGSIIGITIGATFAFTMKPKGFNLIWFLIYSFAILLANYITVQIAIAKPAKLAASISPIEASKVSGYEEKNEKIQTKKLQRKLSPLSLSMIAARGNRKKSTMTMISLCLAGVVFMCASTFVSSVNEEKFARQSWFEFGEYEINISPNAIQVNEYGETGIKKDNPLSYELVDKLNNIKDVKEVIPMQNLSVTYTYNDVTEKDIAAPFKKEDTELINQYLKGSSINYNDMVKNKEIIIAHNEIAKEIFGWKFELGDTVTLKWYNGEKYVEDVFTVSGILENSNKLYKNSDMFKISYNAGWFMMPEDLLTKMMEPGFNLNTRIIVSSTDYLKSGDEIEKEIVALTESNPLLRLSTLRDSLEHHKEQFNMMYTSFMGGALFVIAFSMINLLNTLISNAMARKREFACLGAIGASKKQIVTMILGEGLYFAVINFASTVLFGTLAGYIMVKIMGMNGLKYMEYQFPIGYFSLYSIFVFVVPIVLSFTIGKIINKKPLVERLRDVE